MSASLGMDLPYLVLHFALNSGLDITREGFPFQDTPKSMPSLEAGPCLFMGLASVYTALALPKHGGANAAGFAEAVEDNWHRR